MENNKEYKKEIKISFMVVIIFIIILLLLGGIIYYIYEIHEQKNSNDENSIKTDEINNETDSSNEIENSILFENNINTEENIIYEEPNINIGKYDINGIAVDPGEGTGILDIILEENNYFTIDLVYGGKYTGTYNINNNYLICNANNQEIYEGGNSNKDVETIFEFEIIDNKTIKFLNTKNDIDGFELNKEKTYSIK